DPSVTVRREATVALPKLLGRAALPRLASLKDDPDPFSRARVAEAFAVLAPAESEAARELVRFAKDDPDRRVREAALNGLKPIKTRASREALTLALASKDLSLIGTAADVLGEQSDPSARDALVDAFRASQGDFDLTEARADLLDALGRLGAAESRTLLTEAL